MDSVKGDNDRDRDRDRERSSASRRNTMATSLTNASPSSIHIMANNSNNMNSVYNGNTSLIPTMNEVNSTELSTSLSSSVSSGAAASSSSSSISGNTASSNNMPSQQQQTSGVIHKNVANSGNRLVHVNSACLNNFIIPVLSDVRSTFSLSYLFYILYKILSYCNLFTYLI